MSISNVTSSKLDKLINDNLEAFAKSPTNAGPAPASNVPQGVALRQSDSSDMPPRQPGLPRSPGDSQLGASSQLQPQGGMPAPGLTPFQPSPPSPPGNNDLSGQAKSSAEDSMKSMRDMNNLNMEFQMKTAVMQMEKGMNEAVAKTVKEVGSKIAQLAG